MKVLFVILLTWLVFELERGFVANGEVAFADTCACPDPAPCPSFCLDCDAYDSDCISGKTNARCNGENHENCPDGYEKRPQTGASWRCSAGGTWWTMYHCYRLCLGITTGRCNRCQDGYYAFNNNQTCSLCDAGSYCVGGVVAGQCSAGHFCEAGSTSPTEEPCPPGTYGDVEGLESPTCSGDCSPGHYCPEGSITSTPFKCKAGQWGDAGQTNEYCAGACSAGYFCPEGSSSSTAFVCGNSSVYCPSGAAAPSLVDPGFYSTPELGPASTRTGQAICAKGHYCEDGEKLPCPAGTYTSSIGSDTCLTNLCSPGYFCPEGSTSPTAGPCHEDPENPPAYPAQFYCPEGTSAPLEVLPGYYSTPEDGPAAYRSGQEYADPVLYVVRFGTRYRRVEWQGVCSGDSGSITIPEWINDETAVVGARMTDLEAYDNMELLPLNHTHFEIIEQTAGNPLDRSINSAECADSVDANGFPFEIATNGSLVLAPGATLDFEVCEKYVFEILGSAIVDNSTATCTLTVNIANKNDRPYFEFRTTEGYPRALPSITDFYVQERSAVNTGIGSPVRANDEDVGQEIFFEIMDTFGEGAEDMFYIGSCSGQLYVRSDGLDYIAKNRYDLQIKVCDDAKFFGINGVSQCSVTANISIHVQDINDTPFFVTSPNYISYFEVPENSPSQTVMTPYCLNATGSHVPCSTLDNSIIGLQVDDLDLLNGDSNLDVMLYSISRNDADAFQVISCERGTNLENCTTGTGHSTPAGTMVVSPIANLNYEMKKTYSITVRVNDGRGGGAQRDVDIRITDANDAPTWPSQNSYTFEFKENTEEEYGWLYAIDEDGGDILSYDVTAVWDLGGNSLSTSMFHMDPVSAEESVPVKLILTSPNTFDFETNNRYTVTIRVTDVEGATSSRNITINVKDVNEPPSIVTETLFVPENVPIGYIITPPVAFADVDAGQVGYFTMNNVLDSDMFAIATTSGNVSVRGSLNYEDFRNYSISLDVADNGVPSLKGTKTVTIVVTDEPEPPTFASGQRFVHYEAPTLNTSWAPLIDVTDEDDGDTVTLSIVKQTIASTGRPVYFFDIGTDNPLTLVQNASNPTLPNYESAEFTSLEKTVQVVVRGTDTQGNFRDANILVDVLDTNDRPVLASINLTISEHAPNSNPCTQENYCLPGSHILSVWQQCSDEDISPNDRVSRITYTIVSGNSNNTFDLTDGELTVAAVTWNIQQEDHVFDLVVTATDDDAENPLTSDPATIRITVKGINYKPQVPNHFVNITENGEAFQLLIADMNATDPDNSVMVYEIVDVVPSDARPALFLNRTSGELYTTQQIDYEGMSRNGVITVKVLVRDNNGDIQDSQTAESTVTIYVEDVNEPPAFSSSQYIFNVNEMTTAGAVGSAITAEDPDAADVGNLYYSLPTMVNPSPFSIDHATGVISHDGSLDFEMAQNNCVLSSGIHQCTLTLRVADTANQTAETSVIIKVININEPPSFTGTTCVSSVSSCSGTNIVSIPENIYTVSPVRIGKFTSSDPDTVAGLKISFAVSLFSFEDGILLDNGQTGVDDLFQLDLNGNLYVTNKLDFENRSVYEYNITLSDQGDSTQSALETTFKVIIRVTDVNDIGVVECTTPSIAWPHVGGLPVSIVGSNFGPTEYKVTTEGAAYPPVRVFMVQKTTMISYEAGGCSMVSDTMVNCTSSPSGAGSEFHWRLLVNETFYSDLNFADASLANKYEKPIVSSILNATALPTMGGGVIQIIGDNFGYFSATEPEIIVTYRSKIGSGKVYTASNCSIDFNATSSKEVITCLSAVSTGRRLEFMVSVQKQSLTSWFFQESFSHATPTFSGDQVKFLDPSTTKMRTKGSTKAPDETIVLTGKNFGPIGASLVVTYGPPGDTTKFTATDCAVTVAHQEIQCHYVPGTGSNLRWVVVVDFVSSVESIYGLSYTGPIIDRISGPGAENGRTKGGDTVHLQGQGFGPVTTTTAEKKNIVATYGGPNGTKYTATDCTVVTEDVWITCQTTGGTGRNHGWRVKISGQNSDISFGEFGVGTSYSAPTINYFEGRSTQAVTEGGEFVTLVGIDFGADSTLISATFGPTGFEYSARACALDQEFLHTKMTCELPPGIGTELKWTVYVDGQASKVPTTEYKEPVVSNLVGDVVTYGATTEGGENFTIVGLDFGPPVLHDPYQLHKFTYGPVTGEEFEAMNCTILDPPASMIISNTSFRDDIQRITITGTREDEVHVLELTESRTTQFLNLSSVTVKHEVQTISFSDVENIGGTFTVTFDSSTGCDLCAVRTVETTIPIAGDATAATLRTALIGLSNIDDVAVTRSAPSSSDIVFTVTFIGAQVRGNVPSLSVTDSLTSDGIPSVAVSEVTKGSLPGFKLHYGAESTGCIPWDVSLASLETTIQNAFTGGVDITITKTSTNRFQFVFVSPPDPDALSATVDCGTFTASNTATIVGRNLQGTFQITSNTTDCDLCPAQSVEVSNTIDVTVANSLQSAIDALSNVADVVVTETFHTGTNGEGRTWSITFSSHGNVPDNIFTVTSHTLLGDGPSIDTNPTVTQQGNQIDPLGSIYLEYDDSTAYEPIVGGIMESDVFEVSVSSTTLKNELLNAFIGIEDPVQVTRTNLNDGVGGVQFDITFHGNRGELPLMYCIYDPNALTKDSSSGTGISCDVTKVQNGNVIRDQQITLTWDDQFDFTINGTTTGSDLQTILRTQTNIPTLNVTRELHLHDTSDTNTWDGGYVWTIDSPTLPREDIVLKSSVFATDDDVNTPGNGIVQQRVLGAGSAQCRTAPGVGANMKVLARISNQVSVLSDVSFSYQPPRIDTFTPAIGTTSKTFELTIDGGNFGGNVATDLVVTFQNTPLTIIQNTHNKIVVGIPESLQRNTNNILRISVGGQTTSRTYSFNPPEVRSISAVSPPINLTGPPQEILIRGSSFGKYNSASDYVTVGGSTCLVTEWTHTTILCNITQLDGPLVVNVGSQNCPNGCCPCDFTYEGLLKSPEVTSISRCGVDGVDTQDCITDGGYQITVFGKNLGTSINGKVLIHGQECTVADGNVDYTDTEITCTVPPGEGSGLVHVRQAWKESKENISFFYERAEMTEISPAVGPTKGFVNLTISGKNFGVSGPIVTFNGTSVCENVEWDHTSLICTLPPGQGVVPIHMNVSGREAVNSLLFDYFLPGVRSISPSNGPTDGGYSMEILGSNFGLVGQVFFNDGVDSCEISAYSHDRIVCTVPQGAGADVSVYVESGARESNYTYFSYDPPTIIYTLPETGPTVGGQLVNISGTNFGSNDDEVIVTIGNATCTSPNVFNGGFLQCISPSGIGINRSVNVTVGGQTSQSDVLYHYFAPEITSVSPVPIDADGSLLTIFGTNFGLEEDDPGAFGLRVLVSGENCTNPARLEDSKIECFIPAVPVGDHDIEIYVAEQYAMEEQIMFAACTAGYYGQPGELCNICPNGASCLGYFQGWHYDPESLPSFGSTNRTSFQLCKPSYACIGNDTCAIGYEHKNARLQLCGVCSKNFYRLQGDCVPCPDLAWLILVACFLVAALLCAIAYFLTKHGIQLAAISICIDFCQVVSLFASYDFAWPTVVTGAYSVLSAFNLNLELASPECSVGWDYETKWYIMYFMPIVFGAVFSSSLVVTYVRYSVKNAAKKINAARHRKNAVAPQKPIKNSLLEGEDAEPEEYMEEKVLLVDDGDLESYDASFNRFIDAEFGAFLIMCYYLYLSVMKKCFETFRCTDGDVPLLIAEPSEPCDDTGEFYNRLNKLSWLGIFAYGIGIPGVITYLLLKHRNFIREDQTRRENALNLNETQAAKRLQSAFRGYYVRRIVDPRAILRRHKTLTHIGRTRAKYGKLYEDFTGECYYWRLVLMMRKLVLVMITMFLDDKFKQSTLAFGVLFTSYALQVKKKPYLSRYPDDGKKRRQIKAFQEWKRRAETRNEVQRAAGRVREIQEALFRRARKAKQRMGLVTEGAKEDLLKNHMDFRQLEINPKATETLHERMAREKELMSDEERSKNNLMSNVERRWTLLKKFVVEVNDQDKFVLNAHASEHMKSDALRWLFDYNTLESISLATSMYILLFGLLFDTYAAQSDDIRINLLASVTIALFTVVIILFMSSVFLDMKRKFFPLIKEKFIKEGARGLIKSIFTRKPKKKKDDRKARKTKKVDKDDVLGEPERGQWVSPVNPFATLKSQNADLVRAEEARLNAIMASKMRHEQELEERKRMQMEARARLEEEYRLRMESVEAELAELEALENQENEAMEKEIQAALAAEASAIEMELQMKLEAMSKEKQVDEEAELVEPMSPEDAEVLMKEEEAQKRELEEAAFRIEQEVLLAKAEAEKAAELVSLKAKHADEVSSALQELEKQADEVFAGHRKQQEEIKARLQERRLRKGGTFRKRRPPAENEEEQKMQEIEDRFLDIIEKHEEEQRVLEEEFENKTSLELEKIRERVKEAVEQDMLSDNEFEKTLQGELEGYDMETTRFMEEIHEQMQKELETIDPNNEDLVAQIKKKYQESMDRLSGSRKEERDKLREKMEKMRAERLAKAREEEEAKEAARAKEIEEATQKAEELKRVAFEHETKDLSQEEIDKLHAQYEQSAQELNRKNEEMRNDRKAALEKRLQARMKNIQAKKEAAEKITEVKQAQQEAKIMEQFKPPSKEEIDAELEKIKQEAMEKKARLEEKLKSEKLSQRDKLRDRLAKKKQLAEEKKKKMLQEKLKEEEEMTLKLQEEERQLREKQAEELQRINEAKVEVFLDDSQAKDLAQGVAAWRKRKEELEKQKATQAPKRSDILQADFAAKIERIEQMKKDLESLKGSIPEEEYEHKRLDMEKQLSEVTSLYSNLIEEMDAEINRITNEAAVQKARQKRKLDTLKRFLDPSAQSPTKDDDSRPAAATTTVTVDLDKLNFDDLQL